MSELEAQWAKWMDEQLEAFRRENEEATQRFEENFSYRLFMEWSRSFE